MQPSAQTIITRARRFVQALVCTLTSCALAPVDYVGKECLSRCPDGLKCVQRVCVISGRDSGSTGAANAPADEGGGRGDAGLRDGGLKSDAGIPAGGCLPACAAALVCFNRLCMPPAEVSGQRCTPSILCPSGFFCASNVCIKNGARYCSTVSEPTPTSCLDFDVSSTLLVGWTAKEIPTSGADVSAVTIQSNAEQSPPSVLSSVTAAYQGSAYPTARLERPMKLNWTEASLEFDYKPAIDVLMPETKESVSIATFICDAAGTQNRYQGVWMKYFPGPSGNVANLVMVSDAGPSEQPLRPQPASAGWVHIKLAASADRQKGRLSSRVTVGGELAAESAVNLCSGDWTVFLGLTSQGPRSQMLIDNVVYREN